MVGQQWGAPTRLAPTSPFVSTETPRLTYKAGYRLGEDLARAGYQLSLGKYPGNVRYATSTPGAFTIDRPWGWTPMYNAGAVRGVLQAEGRIIFTSKVYTGTFRLEALQVLRHKGIVRFEGYRF